MRDEVLHLVFLDLQKAYGALDRYRCQEILEGYDVDTRALRLLYRYWERLQMVAQAGGYYGERDSGGPTVAHNIPCGGGCSGPPLEITGGGRSWG